jgi:acyl-CoA thioesterase
MPEPQPELERILDTVTLGGGRGTAAVPDGWGQGRSTYGGLVAALALRAMRGAVDDPDRPPRSLQFCFVAPVDPGEVMIEVRLLRRGGSVTHAEARLEQRGGTVCVGIGAFAADRASAIEVPPPPRPAAPGPEGLDELPFVEGVIPAFTRHFAYRWAIGSPPFSASPSREMGGWCRLRDGAGAGTEERVLALVDAWPAAVLSQLDRRAPASSLSWALELIQPAGAHEPGDGWCFYRAETEAARAGYAHAAAALWDPAGRLLALSRQAVAVFA